MDNYFNEDYIDFKKLAIDEKYIKTKTDNCEYVLNMCIESATDKKFIGLITEPGYSTQSGILDFTKFKRNYKYYFDICTRSKGLKKSLIGFLQKELPPFINLNSSNEDYLVSAMGHYFKTIDVNRKRLIIFHNTENLSGLKGYGTIYKLSEKVRNLSGILITINNAKFETLQKLSNKHSDIYNLLSVFEWKILPPPSTKELSSHCFARGILGNKLIEKLLKTASNFRILNREINKIRDLCIKRGYIENTGL